MISLLVDTCTKYLNLALYKDKEAIGVITALEEKDLSSNLMPIISKFIDDNNVKITDIDKYFVAVGPGSFTGIRIGLSCVKVMAWTQNKKVIPLSSLEIMASGYNNNKLISLIDARRGYVYSGEYNNKLDVIKEDNYIELMNIQLNDNLLCVSYDHFDIDTYIPKIDFKKIINKHFSDEGVNAHSINPNYLKKTEAEEKLNNND